MSCRVLTDTLWEKLKPLLPKPTGRHGKDDRLFLEAVCWIVRTGAPWPGIFHRNLDRGRRSIIDTIHGQKRGILMRFSIFLKDVGDHEWHMIDGSIAISTTIRWFIYLTFFPMKSTLLYFSISFNALCIDDQKTLDSALRPSFNA